MRSQEVGHRGCGGAARWNTDLFLMPLSAVLVGDTSRFAIESGITRKSDQRGQLALGFFVLHVGGRCFGVRSPEVMWLGCSFDSVVRRMARRGKHTVEFGSEPAASIAAAVRTAYFTQAGPQFRACRARIPGHAEPVDVGSSPQSSTTPTIA